MGPRQQFIMLFCYLYDIRVKLKENRNNWVPSDGAHV